MLIDQHGTILAGHGRVEELQLHPTVKPVQMIADAIKDVSACGEIVLDSFGGSGSILIAAEKTGLLASVETSNRSTYDEWMKTAIDYKIEWDRELARRKRLGIIDAPEQLPHPDQVVIDIRAGTANIIGPATREELAELETWIERQKMFEEELDELQQLLEDANEDNEIAFMKAEIAQTEKVLRIIRRALGEKASFEVLKYLGTLRQIRVDGDHPREFRIVARTRWRV